MAWSNPLLTEDQVETHLTITSLFSIKLGKEDEFCAARDLFLRLRDRLLFAGLWDRFTFLYGPGKVDLTLWTQFPRPQKDWMQVYIEFRLATAPLAQEKWPPTIQLRMGLDNLCRTHDPDVALYCLQRILPSCQS